MHSVIYSVNCLSYCFISANQGSILSSNIDNCLLGHMLTISVDQYVQFRSMYVTFQFWFLPIKED